MSNLVLDGRYISACVESLKEYDLGEVVALQPRGMFLLGDTVEEPSKASIVGEGMLSFSSGISGENRSDAQNAFLYASLVANKLFPEEYQGKEWYMQFRDVMTKAGWTPISKYYNDLHVSGTSVRMDKLVLDILGSVVAGLALPGPTTALMLKVAGDAIAALQKRDTELTLYERNLLNHGVGGVTAGACTENNGVATMALGAVRFLRKNTSTKVLFVDVDTRNVNLYRGETVFEKNDLLAKATREVIASKLVAHAGKIADYDI
ncbi:hypothetical protein [Pseudomonas sp. B21-048]|uniref:hypothetical protein n=1 Tax=Pseudomonas sp. B21-048 TaxID=2895490 RepID=UPI00215FC088|nr:hypothetical protein [Pseudomonas sp. B21-048]UVK99385.1 hypothetical protein LOY56_02925 [Pseudomonas sp. B21-048]